MRFVPPILCLVAFSIAAPADAKSPSQHFSAASSASLNQLARLHKRITRDDSKRGEIKLTAGVGYKKFDNGGKSGTTPLTASYQASDSQVVWALETDGYSWKSPEAVNESGLSETRVKADWGFGSETNAWTLGYGFGLTPEGDNGERAYTHTLHLAFETTHGKVTPNVDLTRSWSNGDTPGIWDRSTELYIGADYKTERQHKWSFGFTRQIVSGADSLSSAAASYTVPLSTTAKEPLKVTFGLTLGLESGNESKSAKLLFSQTF